MILKKTDIKKILRIIALAISFLLPLSCNNSVDPVLPYVPVISPGEYGLYASVAGESPRTAIPSWPASPEYYVEYSKLSDWDDASKHIIKTPASDSAAFTLDGNGAVTNFYLPLSSDTWVVESGVKNGAVKQLTATKTIPLSPESPLAIETFFLQMPVSSNGKGSIELKVEAESGSGISFIEMIIQCSNNTSITATRAGDLFTASNIPNGKQKIIINAYESTDNSGRQIFSTIQDVIIYAGLTTNQWLINGYAPAGNKYTITSQMVTDFIPQQYYVDSTLGNNSYSGATKDFPFQTIDRAIQVIGQRNETSEFTIHVKDGSSFSSSATTNITKSIRIECWKNVPNDMSGSVTWLRTGTGTAITIGTDGARAKLTIISANDTCGLTINGNNDNHTCLQVYNGDFIMDGGKITAFGVSGSTNLGAVYLPDNTDLSKRRVFTMRKGEISGNTAVCPGVYAAPGTSFYMEGGKIIKNTSWQATGYAVGVYGTMYASGLVQIGGSSSTDDNKHTDGSKANLYLSLYGGVVNRLVINGTLLEGTHIGVQPQFNNPDIPSTTNQVAVTRNYSNNEAPSAFFSYDGPETYAFVRSTNPTYRGEAALIAGGGKVFSARDLTFTFTVSPNQTLTLNTTKTITINPVIKLGTTTLYYKAEDKKVYWNYTGGTYSNPVSDYYDVSWNVELSMYGTVLASQPSTTPTANVFTIPALPEAGTYTLSVTATYMGIKYNTSFDFVCSSS